MADLGGSILTGIDGNPLAVLARQLHAPMHDINFAHVPLYLPDGSVPDSKLDARVGAASHCACVLYVCWGHALAHVASACWRSSAVCSIAICSFDWLDKAKYGWEAARVIRLWWYICSLSCPCLQSDCSVFCEDKAILSTALFQGASQFGGILSRSEFCMQGFGVLEGGQVEACGEMSAV